MKCYFCGRNAIKMKFFHIHDEVKSICGQCHSIHKLLRGQTRDSIIKMINAMDKDTCYTCINLRKNREEICKRHNYTGIGTHMNEYPFTYANHGCVSFKNIKDSI